MKLYELANNYRVLKEMLLNDEVDEQSFNDTVEALDEDISTKLDNIGVIIGELKAEQLALKEEEKRLSQRKKVAENAEKRLKEYTEMCMRARELKKLKTNRYTFSFRKSQSVTVLDEEQVPTEYLKVTKKPILTEIKKAILEAEQEGKALEWAKLEQRESLSVR